MPDPTEAPADTVVGEAPIDASDVLAQERDRVGSQPSWQPYEFSVANFEVAPETLTEFGNLLMTDADDFKAGLEHGLGQAMSGLPNFGMSTDGLLADGEALTTAYYAAFQSLVMLMGEVCGGLTTLGSGATVLSLRYSFADGDSADLLDAMRHLFGDAQLWGDDARSADMDRLREQAEENFEEIRQNEGDASVDMTVGGVDDDGVLESRTESTPISGDAAAIAATDRTHDEINDVVDQQQAENDIFPAGDWDRVGTGLERDPLDPQRPPEGHPVEEEVQ